MGLEDIGFPTFESEADFFKQIKGKKPKASPYSSDVGFDLSLDSIGNNMMGNQVWDYSNPFGAPSKKMPKRFKGKRGKVLKKQPQQSMYNMDLTSMMSPMFNEPQPAPTKRMHKGSASTMKDAKQTAQNVRQGGTVIKNVVTRFNEKMAERTERKNFEKSQPNATKLKGVYSVNITKPDTGENFTEHYESPNQAFSAQQKWRGQGYTVSAVRIER